MVVSVNVKRWFGNMTTKSAMDRIGSIFDHYQRKLRNADTRLRAMCKKLMMIPRPSDVNALRSMYYEHVSHSNYIMTHLETQRKEWERAIVAKQKGTERVMLPSWPIHIRKSRRTGEWVSEIDPDVEAFYEKAGYQRYTENKKAVNTLYRVAANEAKIKSLVSRAIQSAVRKNERRNQAMSKSIVSRAIQSAVQENERRNQAMSKSLVSRAIQSVLQKNKRRQEQIEAAKKAAPPSAAEKAAMRRQQHVAQIMNTMKEMPPHVLKSATRVFPSIFYRNYWTGS
jgi:hypothetical protein